MDCQKFDLVVMDALYEELDELTYAALRRHVESCSRCGEIWNGLRATRDAVSLPIEEPSDDLEQRILAAVSAVQARTPWHRKALRALAWAGSHAMRPQLAMAALFVLVIGSSLLLLRAKPGTVGISPVRVTERGVPAPDEGDLAQAPAAAPLQAAAAPTEPAAEGATDKPKEEAEKLADKGAAAPNADAVKALADARGTRDRSGCDAAVRAYDDVGARFPNTPQAADAMWEAAQCQKSLGNNDKARELLLSLKSSEGYKQRADEALRETDGAATNNLGQAVANRGSAAGAVAASPPAAAAPGGGATGKAAAAAEQAQRTKAAPGGGPGRNVTAAPAPKRSESVDAAF